MKFSKKISIFFFLKYILASLQMISFSMCTGALIFHFFPPKELLYVYQCHGKFNNKHCFVSVNTFRKW